MLIAGDFNDEPERSAALEEALATGEWSDLAQLEAQKVEPPNPLAPTFVTGSGSSRIDQIYANAEAQAAFSELIVGEEGEYAFPGHRPVFASFRWAQRSQKVTKLAKPRCIPRAAVKPCKQEQEARSQWLKQEGLRLIEEAARDWNAAAQAKDTETLWKLWCTLVETLLLARAQEEGLWQPAPDEEQHFRGRGSPARLQKEQIVPPSGPIEVGPTEVVLRRLDNLRRRIAHLARLQQSAQRGLVEARHLWAKIKAASRESLSEEQRTPLLAQRATALCNGG